MRQSGQFAEAEIWDGFTESSLEEALRSVCAPQPLSLFAIPELVGLRNNPDTCQLVLSFLKRRSNIFSLSSSVFGHSVSLIDSPPRHTEKYGLGGNDSKDEPDTSMPQNHVADRSEARASEVLNSLSSHLCSVINEAGGRLSLDRLEWDQVCMAQFASQVDLEKYLEEQPHFLIWVSEGGKMVSTVSADTRQPGGQAGQVSSRLDIEMQKLKHLTSKSPYLRLQTLQLELLAPIDVKIKMQDAINMYIYIYIYISYF